MATRCKFGKVKSGPRKGRCRKRKLSGAASRGRKAASKGSQQCRFGKVKKGRRKGQCLKAKRRRSR